MLRLSFVVALMLIGACESSSGSSADEPKGGQGSGAMSGADASSDAGAESVGGSDGQAAGGGDASGTLGGQASAGQPSGGASPEPQAGGPSAGSPATGDRAVSELDECKYAPDQCDDKPTKPHYWECEMDPATSPGAGCEPSGVGAVSSWCCPDSFCSAYTGAKALCEGLFPEQPSSFICAMGTPGLEDCKQPNPISLQQVYCCP